MKKGFIYTILLALVAAVFLPSCGFTGKKRLNRYVSFWHRDKIPYGTQVAYSNLKYIFPAAAIDINKNSPFYSNDLYDITEDAVDSVMVPEPESPARKTVYVYVLQALHPDSLEAQAILEKSWSGDDVFISASYIGTSILNRLQLGQTGSLYQESGDSVSLQLMDPVSGGVDAYRYPGFLSNNHFNKMDSSVTEILGANDEGKANFVKISYEGGGNIYIHLSPFAFSNFFLLHKKNIHYYEKALSYLPATAGYVLWDDYFRNPSRRDFSAFSFLMKQEAFRWAIPLIIILCGIIFFIESKRRQRQIPAREPLRNSSVDFVNTIGRLYFQQKNHKNLAQKMIAHFLDYIRNRYQVSTSVLDDHFIEKITYKSGIAKEEWEGLAEDIREIGYYDTISEQALLALSARIEKLKKLN